MTLHGEKSENEEGSEGMRVREEDKGNDRDECSR